MITLSEKRIKELEKNFSGKKIAVIGDMMLDGYFWGDVKRISPEAPVPVLEVEEEFFRFGGAANVALNISTLGGIPVPVGIIGYDNYGTIFTSLLNKFIENQINELDGIILQDYNKGVLTESLIKNVIDLANKSKKLITVDPKFENFYCYKNSTVFKPNRKEAEAKLGAKIFTAEEISIAGKKLMEQLKAKYLLLTLGEEGIAIFENGKPVERMETKARKVADVSGAGDTVISTLTIAMAAGADILEACYLANYAGGLVCEEVGIVPIEQKKLFETVLKEHR
ncbi:MAG: PfkB family carbohydrate kinase [Ignavibacteriaceae bacterium]